MEVKTLQGINHESPYSVVKITTDGEPKTDLIDLITSFHPVFLIDYDVNGHTISIRTKLPQLWREAANALNNLANGAWTEKEAKDFLLNHLLRGQIYSMSAIPILEAAHRIGLETNIAFVHEGLDYNSYGYPGQWNRYYRIGVGKYSGITVSAASTGDSSIAKLIQRDKIKTNHLVDSLRLPMAKWEKIDNPEHLREVFPNYKKPVVIKPVGLSQGHGVTTNINNIDQAIKAFKYAEEMLNSKPRQPWQKQIIIQEQVSGDDYRILVIDGKMEIATMRVPAFVIGDGKNNIQKLIEVTNMDPRRDLQNPAHILKPINFDKPLNDFLEEQNLTLETIPEDGERVYVRKVASMSQGGITEDFTKKVHPQIRYLVESIAASAHANVLGVDVICRDISKPLTADNGSFIEMNTMPEAYLNAFPVIGDQYPEIGEKIITGLLRGIEPTKHVVFLGGDLEQVRGHLRDHDLMNEGERTGLLYQNQIFINGEKMSDVENVWIGMKAVKLNASLDTLVIHHPDKESLLQHGTGFDRIDLIVTDQELPEFKKYREKGLIEAIEVM